jgi:hypothetical protein
MYCRVKDLKQAYKDTGGSDGGLNLAYVFDRDHPERLDPAAAQWFVYWLRHEKDSTVTLASVEGFNEVELAEAVTRFFLPPTEIPASTTGLPASTSASVGSDGASLTSTTQD